MGGYHPPVMLFQSRALGVPGPIMSAKDRGKEGIKCLCFLYASICEVTNLIKQWTNTIFDPPFPVNVFKNNIFVVLHSAGQLEL